MEERLEIIEQNQKQLTDAVMELNSNLAQMGYSTTESIKAIMEGFQSINTAIHGVITNLSEMENRIGALEQRQINMN